MVPGPPMHGWAPHYYCGTTGHALEFTRDQWYEQLFKANKMEALIKDQWAAMGEFDRKHAIKLVVDEWGSWHPAGTEINKRHLYEQMGTMRDALVAALSLDTFNRHADKVDMANVAQLINNLHSLFLADGDRFVATPTYHVYTMYRPHQGARAVRLDVQAADVTFQTRGGPERIFRLAGSASRSGPKDVTLTLVHTPRNRTRGSADRPQGRRGGTCPAHGPDPWPSERAQHIRSPEHRDARGEAERVEGEGASLLGPARFGQSLRYPPLVKERWDDSESHRLTPRGHERLRSERDSSIDPEASRRSVPLATDDRVLAIRGSSS